MIRLMMMMMMVAVSVCAGDRCVSAIFKEKFNAMFRYLNRNTTGAQANILNKYDRIAFKNRLSAANSMFRNQAAQLADAMYEPEIRTEHGKTKDEFVKWMDSKKGDMLSIDTTTNKKECTKGSDHVYNLLKAAQSGGEAKLLTDTLRAFEGQVGAIEPGTNNNYEYISTLHHGEYIYDHIMAQRVCQYMASPTHTRNGIPLFGFE